MADIQVTDFPSYPDLFRQTILVNLGYWQEWVAANLVGVAALEHEQQNIVRAIGYALEFEAVWSEVAELIIQFSIFMERWGRWEIWSQVLERAIAVARTNKDTARQTTLTALLARLLFQQSCFKESVYYYRQTIRLARCTEDSFNEGRACTNLGYYYMEQGQWWRAEVLCCHAMRLFEQSGSDHGRAHTENHLGLLYTRQYLWDKAQQHFERACALWQVMEDHHGLMRGFINLSMLYNEMRRPSESLPCLEKALQAAQLTGEEFEIGKIYKNMSVAYQQKGDLTQAETYAWQAEVIFRRFSHSFELALTWISLGLIYIDQQKWQEAREYLQAALTSCRDLKNEHGQIEALIGLIEYELARGNHQNASIQLNELERLIQSYNGRTPPRHLQSLLHKYRHSVTISAPKTPTVPNLLKNYEQQQEKNK